MCVNTLLGWAVVRQRTQKPGFSWKMLHLNMLKEEVKGRCEEQSIGSNDVHSLVK